MRGHAPDARLAARKKLSAPIVEALKPWFEKQLSPISSGSTLTTDIRYALSHWPGLTRLLEDGRLELDTNPVENAIRPVATGGSLCTSFSTIPPTLGKSGNSLLPIGPGLILSAP